MAAACTASTLASSLCSLNVGLQPLQHRLLDHPVNYSWNAEEAALRAVVRNKGAPGVERITVRQLPSVLQARWPEIEDQLLRGCYQPQPVRRVQIPKPDGGMRNRPGEVLRPG